MPQFIYEAKTRAGEVRTGVVEADDEAGVSVKLRAQQLTPVKVKKKSILDIQIGGGGSITPKDLVIFTRQFATMIDAGLPLVQCLEILSAQNDNPAFAKILRAVKVDVEGGHTFSESLAKHPKVFDTLFCNLIRAGEVGGILDTILGRLAAYIEKRAKLARQVKGALTYPVGVFVIAILVIGVMMVFVIPSFEAMFKEFGNAQLPALTMGVINLSHFFVDNLVVILGSTFAGVGGLKYWARSRSGTIALDKLVLQLPAVGPVMRKIAVARFTRTLGTLLASGVPILDAMEIVAKSSGNYVIESGILSARAKIAEGKNMAEPLAEAKVFPPMVVQMIGVGEQTGALDTMLNKIADFYEEEVDVAVAALTSLLEPVMMVFIGGSVGVMMIAMYLPIFTIAGQVKSE